MRLVRGAALPGLLVAVMWGMGCASSDPDITRQGGPLPGEGATAGTTDVGPGGGGSAGVGTVSWCQAFAVMQAKCQRCHQDPPKNGAPMSLLTWEDTHAPWSATQDVHDVMLSAVERDFMPYVALNKPPVNLMPPVESLTADEKTTLVSWLKQGALLEGGADCP